MITGPDDDFDLPAIPEEIDHDDDIDEVLHEILPDRTVDGDHDGGDLVTQDRAMQAMAAIDPGEAQALQAEWGDGFMDNLALARRGFDHVATPELTELANETGLGDDPRIIRALAKFGASLSALDAEQSAVRLIPRGDAFGGGGGASVEALEERHQDLSAAIHEALDRGDRRTAEKLEVARTRVARRLVGGQPIIGEEGRAI